MRSCIVERMERRFLLGASSFTLGVLLAGCTVGPEFEAPAAPAASRYTARTLTDASSSKSDSDAAAQQFEPGQDIPGMWWTLFHSQPLDALIRQSLKDNPDLQTAQAALRVAMENVKAQIGFAYPTAVMSGSASRNKDATVLSPVLASSALFYNLYQSEMTVSWTPDIWGGNKRRVEALRAQADAQQFQLQAAYVALTSNIVAAAVQEASLQAQITTADEIIADELRILEIEKRQRALGQIAGADVTAQETFLAQTEETLPALQKQLAQQRDLLTALAGHLPVDGIKQTFTLQSLALPGQLPISLPSMLVAHRPDIRMAEENLHAASAQIGVAVADRLPNITLSASDGSVATTLGQLLSPGSNFWGLGAGVAQPIFEGGTLLHRERAARAAYDQAAAQYRSTVISAFQNVADVLHAIQADSDTLRAAAIAEAAAAHSLAITEREVALGQVSRLASLNAEQADRQTRLAVIQAEAFRLADTAALFQALGGGWWNRADLANEMPERCNAGPRGC